MAKELDMLLVASKTKEALKDSGCNVSSDALEGLNKLVHKYIEQASARAEANGRKTVRAHDFLIEGK
jgi:histone H3/H4